MLYVFGGYSMKKILSFFSVLFISIFLCVSCSDKGIEKGSIKEYRLKLIKQSAPDAPPYLGILAFAEKLEELSDGTMTVDINMIAPMVSIDEVVEPLINGECDMVLTAYGYADLLYKAPALEILGQAYIFRDYKHFTKFFKSEYAEELRIYLDKINIINTMPWYYGIRHTTSHEPINSLADFNKRKMRMPPVTSSVDFAKAIGAIPVVINFDGIYHALATKYVDGQENPLTMIEAGKFYEIQKYIAITAHSIGLAVPLINKKVYDSFSAEQEAWYNEAIEYGRQVCYDITIEQESYLLEKFETEYGMTITYPDIDELREAMLPYYEKLEEQFGINSVSKILEIN